MKLKLKTRSTTVLVVLAGLLGVALAQGKKFDVLDLINPLIGTINGGHVFPGASLPYSMAKAGPDTNTENQGGFDSAAERVIGFSHMHDSGTGGAASLGNFPIFPHPSCPGDDISQCKFSTGERAVPWVNGSTKARPGSFSIQLENGITADSTVTKHAALYRFKFPDHGQGGAPLSPLILLDVMDLPVTRQIGNASVNPDTGRITATGGFTPSFGQGGYVLHSCVDFRGAKIRGTGVFQDKETSTANKSVKIDYNHYGRSAGAFVRFNAPPSNRILVRVGVSFMSVDQACRNAERELADFEFDKTVKLAEDAWRDKLSVIKVDAGGVHRDMEVIFWSGIYRSMLSPQDYTGENPLWQSDEPYYDSFYCIWDSYRVIHPLLTIVDPNAQIDMVRTLIDVYRHEGFLPDCRMSLCKGWTQGGSNADVLLVDSYIKGLRGAIDWETGYEAIVKDAEVQPPNWNVEGRGSVEDWKTMGFLPINLYEKRTISRSVEYAYNDFCIAQMAQKTGRTEDYEKYIHRSRNWRVLFKQDQTSSINGEDTGFVGFLQPRRRDGEWGHQDPAVCSNLNNFHGCYLSTYMETYEGSPWLYTFYTPHDMTALVGMLGGPETFVRRLQFFHDSGLAYMGNEPNFLPVYQYHYAGRPDLSTKQIHAYIPRLFYNALGGIPGNDDSGAMGSFVALSMMGLFPVAGQDVYLISAPFFKELRITNALTKKEGVVRSVGFDPTYAERVYIKGVKRDGVPWTKNWIGHDFFTEGGVLEITLGTEEEVGTWGTREEDLPPSIPLW